jgi:hypothetical protein
MLSSSLKVGDIIIYYRFYYIIKSLFGVVSYDFFGWVFYIYYYYYFGNFTV